MDVKMRNFKQLKQRLAVFLLCLATAGLAGAQYTPEAYPTSPAIPGPNKFLNQSQMKGSLENWNYGVTNTLYLQTANNPSNPTRLADLNLTLSVNNVTFTNTKTGAVVFGGSDESSYYNGSGATYQNIVNSFGCGSATVTFSGVNAFGAEDNGVSANFGGTNDYEAMLDLTPGNANVTFTSGSTTNFYGRVNFGSENNAFAKGVNTVSTVVFERGADVSFYQQNTYFGTGGYNTYDPSTGLYTGSANGGDAVLYFGGQTAATSESDLDTNSGVVVNQRIMIGGGATSFSSTKTIGKGTAFNSTNNRKTGKSTIVFNNGYNAFYWDKAADNPDPYSDYYGFTASATSGSQGIAESGGVDLTLDGGCNYFYTETRIGGGYDFTTFGNINTSSDDFEIVWGGVNNISVGTYGVDGGGIHNIFAGRTFFGAANSETTMNFNAGKTYFTGQTTSYHESLADVRPEGIGTGASNNYNGQDIPYVYFGGKQLNNQGTEQNDQSYYNVYYRQDDANDSAFLIYDDQVDWTRAPKTVVNFNGGINRIKTTAFFGGADYSYLDGSDDAHKATISTTTAFNKNVFTDDSYNFIAKSGQVLANYANYQKYVNDPTNPDYQQYKDLFTAAEAEQVANTPSNVFLYRNESGQLCTYSMMLDDGGSASVSLTNGTLWLGVANSTKLLMQYGDGHEDIYSSNRNEQVQLIGTNASFTGTDGVLKFSVDKNGYTVKNYSGEQVQQLNSGRMVYGDMTIAGGFDPTSGVVIQIAEAATLMNLGAGTQEYFTVETFENSNGNQLKIGEKVNGQYKYFKDYAFYSVGVEDLADPTTSLGDPSLNFKDQARLHVYAKDPREVLNGEGNLGHNVDDFFDFAQDVEQNEGSYPDNGDGYPEDVYEVVDNVVQAPTVKDALEIFDNEFGGAYGSNVHAQIRRLSMINNFVTSRVINQDMGLDNLCPRCCNCGCECETDGSCYNCGYGCGMNNGRRCCTPHVTNVWGSYFAEDGNSDFYQGYTPYKYDSNGCIIGIERMTERCGRWGLYFSTTQSHLKLNSMVGHHNLESSDYMLGLYGKWDACLTGGYVMVNGNVSYNDYDSDRAVQTNNTKVDYFNAGYGGLQASASIERGWAWVINRGFVFNPFMGVQYSFYNTDGFDETGTSKSTALRVSELDYSSLRSNLGFRVNRDFVFGYRDSQILRLTINASWVHECLNKTVLYQTQMMYNTYDPSTAYNGYASPVWNMRGNSTGRDWANIGLGVNYDISQRWTLSGGYNVFLNSCTTVHSGVGTLQLNF